MKMKKINHVRIVILGLAFGLMGCKKEIKTVDIENVESKGGAFALQDSLETLYMMQSNPELMLADRIISKNSTYVLDMSENEATELHIPAELYQKYVEVVKNMNSSNDHPKANSNH